jgi:hypothetical protein
MIQLHKQKKEEVITVKLSCNPWSCSFLKHNSNATPYYPLKKKYIKKSKIKIRIPIIKI